MTSDSCCPYRFFQERDNHSVIDRSGETIKSGETIGAGKLRSGGSVGQEPGRTVLQFSKGEIGIQALLEAVSQ